MQNVGIVLPKKDYKFLLEESEMANCQYAKDLCKEAEKQAVACPNEKYIYLYFEDVEWDKAKLEIRVIEDVLAELLDYEIIKVDKESGNVVEIYDGEEHVKMLSVVDGKIVFATK